MPKTKSRTRVRRDDIFDPSASILKSEPERNFGEPVHKHVEVYTFADRYDYLNADDYPMLMGDGDILAEDRDIAFAMTTIIKGRIRYYVKRDSMGRFFNPIGMTDEWTHNKIRHHTSDKQWRWHEVTERVFNFYRQFLKTKNVAHHRNAEREGL